mmetsp:Transcript_61056/g.157447  ORF Transcript_61056/g.157447 Transcript_61056/m.157447 type:complete len:339 (+) Transcript_61056:369-1385(+)
MGRPQRHLRHILDAVPHLVLQDDLRAELCPLEDDGHVLLCGGPVPRRPPGARRLIDQWRDCHAAQHNLVQDPQGKEGRADADQDKGSERQVVVEVLRSRPGQSHPALRADALHLLVHTMLEPKLLLHARLRLLDLQKQVRGDVPQQARLLQTRRELGPEPLLSRQAQSVAHRALHHRIHSPRVVVQEVVDCVAVVAERVQNALHLQDLGLHSSHIAKQRNQVFQLVHGVSTLLPQQIMIQLLDHCLQTYMFRSIDVEVHGAVRGAHIECHAIQGALHQIRKQDSTSNNHGNGHTREQAAANHQRHQRHNEWDQDVDEHRCGGAASAPAPFCLVWGKQA